jgi:transposase
MAVADRHGLPIACGIASGQRHEVRLVDETLAARFVRPLPRKLIGDKAYDSDALDVRLMRRGVEMIAPNKRARKRTQDGRQLRRYRRRWHIERLFSWLLCCRPLLTRYEAKAENFLGFLQLACALILLRRL